MKHTHYRTVFISYSRRQLYFAESVALHLQNKGLDVWFDLQQLNAGTIWADGLKDGIENAGILVLIVSQASLASPYVEDEWRGAIKKGNEIVLVVFEAVEIPESLQTFPTFDCRNGLKTNLGSIIAYLKEEAEPRYDKIPKPKRIEIANKIPRVIRLVLIAQFSLLLGTILVLLFFLVLFPTQVILDNVGPAFLVLTLIFFGLGLWHGNLFLRNKLNFKKVKRTVLFSAILFVPTFYIVQMMISSKQTGVTDNQAILAHIILLVVVTYNLFVYFFVLRRSAGFLRWMQPEEGLQRLRRKVHKPLASNELSVIGTESSSQHKVISYTIHHDAADQPLAKWIRKNFNKVGHNLVSLDENPLQHIAILSNRSSQEWVQNLTSNYAGTLIYIVASTIEFKDSLKETGRYQWIDSRNLDERDVLSLARSLSNDEAWKREAALEATPDKIDSWEIPSGIILLNTLLEIFGAYVLISGIANLLPTGQGDTNDYTRYALLLIVIGIISFGLIARGLIQRKVPALVLYGIILVNLLLVSYFGNIALFKGLEDKKWLLLAISIPLLAYSAIDGLTWLPGFSKPNNDEVGVHKNIVRAFWKKRVILVTIWIIVIAGFVIWASSKL